MARQVSNRTFFGRLRSKPPGIVSRQAWPIWNAAMTSKRASCAPRSSRKLPRYTKAKPHNHKPLPGSRQGFFAKFGGATMEISAWNSLKRARDLLRVAGRFAAKGVDEDDSCRDLAEKFATLLDLIESTTR
jgi:hypothetical protein